MALRNGRFSPRAPTRVYLELEGEGRLDGRRLGLLPDGTTQRGFRNGRADEKATYSRSALVLLAEVLQEAGEGSGMGGGGGEGRGLHGPK